MYTITQHIHSKIVTTTKTLDRNVKSQFFILIKYEYTINETMDHYRQDMKYSYTTSVNL